MEGTAVKDRPNLRDSAIRQSFRRAKDELSKRQHLLVVAARLTIAFLFGFGVYWGWRDRFVYDPERNPASPMHVVWMLMILMVLIQMQYGIAHLVAVLVPSETPTKSKKLTLYILETLIGLALCGPSGALAYSAWQITPAVFPGVYSDDTEVLSTVYAQTADPNLRRILGYYELCFLPIAALYAIQMGTLVGEMRPELQVHHVVSYSFFLVYQVAEVSSATTVFSFTQLFFGYIEFPLFAALVHYRLTIVGGAAVTDTPPGVWNRNRLLFSVLRFYWGVTRVAMVTLVAVGLVQQYEYLTTFLTVYYTIGTVVQVVTLGLTQREIHGIHAKLAKNHAAAVAFTENGRAPSMRSNNTLAEARRSMMSVRAI